MANFAIYEYFFLMKYVFLFLAIILEVFGSSMLLKSESFSKIKPTLLMIVAFVGAFYFLSKALKFMPLSITYALWAGVGLVLTALVSFFVFKQKLDAAALIGIAFILVGVLVINLFSKTVTH